MDQCQWNELLQVKRFISSNVLLWPQFFSLEDILILHILCQIKLKEYCMPIVMFTPNPDYAKKMLPNWAIYLYHNPDKGFCFHFHFCPAFLMSFLALISSIHCLIQLNQKSFVKWGKRTWFAEKSFYVTPFLFSLLRKSPIYYSPLVIQRLRR